MERVNLTRALTLKGEKAISQRRLHQSEEEETATYEHACIIK